MPAEKQTLKWVSFQSQRSDRPSFPVGRLKSPTRFNRSGNPIPAARVSGETQRRRAQNDQE